jgi:DNA-binding response OmpR family regulator
MPTTSRILLVDDVPMFRELGQVFLSRSGPVDLADTAAAALQSAAERRPGILVADMHLPDMEGPELCRRFKTDPGLGSPRVVLMARPGTPADHALAVRAGADDVLFKPLERDTLIACVRRLTEEEGPRALPRAPMERMVEIVRPGRQVRGVIRNVSRGGVFLAAPEPMKLAEEVSLQFCIEDQSPLVVSTAQVVWTRPQRDGIDHVGLRFLEIDPGTVQQLDHYITERQPGQSAPPQGLLA